MTQQAESPDLSQPRRAAPRGSRHTRARWRFQVTIHDDFEAVRTLWLDLQQDLAHPFVTWEWASAWWTHFGSPRLRLALTVVSTADGEPVVLLPLFADRVGPLRRLRWVGTGAADILGPVHRAGTELVSGHAMRAALDYLRAWDVLIAEQMPAQPWLAETLHGRTVRTDECSVLRRGSDTWSSYLAGRSANFRDQITKKWHRLERSHHVSLRLADDPARLHNDVETLIRLHEARWSGDGSFSTAPARAFHHDFARAAFDRGWLRLWLLELDGVPRAAWYGLRFANQEWSYQLGRDPSFDRDSLGLLISAHSVEAALDDGVSHYQFLRGDDAYKRRFANDARRLETVACGRGPLGNAALGLIAQRRRLPPRVRSLLAERATSVRTA